MFSEDNQDELGGIMEEKLGGLNLQKGRMYYHCGWCGVVFEDQERTKPLVNLKAMFGQTGLPNWLHDYQITTSVCQPCLPAYQRQIQEELSQLG